MTWSGELTESRIRRLYVSVWVYTANIGVIKVTISVNVYNGGTIIGDCD